MGVEGYRGQRIKSRAMRRGSRARWESRDTEARESNPVLCGGGPGQDGSRGIHPENQIPGYAEGVPDKMGVEGYISKRRDIYPPRRLYFCFFRNRDGTHSGRFLWIL